MWYLIRRELNGKNIFITDAEFMSFCLLVVLKRFPIFRYHDVCIKHLLMVEDGLWPGVTQGLFLGTFI